ncbi:MAG: hypothetical protein C0603_09335 [Denitrovibrio sp.]|nr:MAG: hypothetical protein C0603_09335 [Denitrovibrio sp.]
MKLTAKTYYALVASVDLTKNYGKGPLRAASIAEKHNIPTRFLELILNELKSAGVIDSKRGAEGGFYLTDSPETITVYDLVRAIEGEITIVDCAKVSGQGECMFQEYMGGLQSTIINYFKNTTLKQLADSAKEELGVLNYVI